MGAPSLSCLAWSAAFGATLVATVASPALPAPLSPPRAAVSPLLLLRGLFLCYFVFLTRGTPPEDLAFASQVSNLMCMCMCMFVCVCCMCMVFCTCIVHFGSALFFDFHFVQSLFLQITFCTQRVVPAYSFFLRFLSSFSRASFRPPLP